METDLRTIRLTIAEALARARRDLELPPQAVAHALGLDPKLYGRLERGDAADWWRITIGDRSVRLVDLPVGMIDDLAQQFGVSWTDVIDRPLAQPTLQLARLLVARVADWLGTPLPAGDETVEQLTSRFDTVPSDLPPVTGDASGVDPTGLPRSTST